MQLSDDLITTREVLDWKGLHLLHFQGSTCSQKVRILLAEKGIDYASHPVDLPGHENTRPRFLGINPRGVVPVLVHDGVVHVESNDILEYLDGLPSELPSFFPRDEAESRWVRESLDLEDGLHMDLRTLTMGFVVPGRLARKSAKTLDAFARSGAPDAARDREVAWWRNFAENGIPAEQARASAAAYAHAFEGLEKRLQDRPWLIGDRISVLEIAWFISLHRLGLAGYPLARHPRLERHYATLCERPSFAREVAQPGLMGLGLRAYGHYRRLSKTRLCDVL